MVIQIKGNVRSSTSVDVKKCASGYVHKMNSQSKTVARPRGMSSGSLRHSDAQEGSGSIPFGNDL